MFIEEKNNFERASFFFVYFWLSLHDYDVKMPNFTFHEVHVNKRRRICLSLSKLKVGPK